MFLLRNYLIMCRSAFLINPTNSFTNSNHSYGSHKNRPFKDESHKGSLETLDGEEKKDASKEDLEGEREETGA